MKKNLVTSAVILICAGLITRILGFVYRIYMSGIIGAEGMGLYQLVLPVYTLAWSITCSGFTTTISKLTSAQKAKGRYGNMLRFLSLAIIITTTLGIILGIIIYSFSDIIASQIFNEPRIELSLKILGFGVPFMAAGSCIRGYFYGLHDSLIPAISQVLEQVARMFVIYILSYYLLSLGLEVAVAAAVVGIVVGEILSFLYVAFAFKDYNKKGVVPQYSYTVKKSLGMLIALSVPLSLSRVTGSLLSTVENILIPRRLMVYGMSHTEALAEFGKLTGMAMPLIQLPSVILVALSISLVPAISEALELNNYKTINNTVSKTMTFSMVIGIGAAGGFIIFANVIGQIIYSQDIAFMLMYLGLLSPFLYTNMLLTGILNGLGQQLFIFRNSLIASVISISFVYFLVPHVGVYGFILGWFVSLLCLSIINIKKIRQVAKIKIEGSTWFFKPIISVAAAMVFISTIKSGTINMLGLTWGTGFAMTIMGLVYFGFIFLTGCLEINDVKNLLGRGGK